MGRPKGSKNKAKEAVTKVEGYKPAPVTPEPEKKVLVCDCTHTESLHYGTPDRHCNTNGCACLRFQPK